MRVLLVDDEAAARYGARRLLESAGHEVVEAASGEDCLTCLSLSRAEVILLDYQLGGGMDGLGVLAALKERPHAPPVVLFTAQGSERIAVEALKSGAWDYLVKPASPDELVLTLERAGEHFRATRENRQLRDEVAQLRPKGLVGESAGMKLLRDQISLVGPSPANVLILGESGTGKEVVARALHEASKRTGPFVAVNCGALPASLVESELFGHEKGAFTGALTEREGRIRQADGGTIFLDEIGDMPLEAQVRLLRVLEDRVVEPLGGSRTVPVDIRVLAATHRDLRQMVAEGRFREDLFFRLDVMSLHLSPLRSRGQDILSIAATLLEKLTPGQKLSMSPKAESALLQYPWPGNVRELRNVMERASILCRGGEIGPEHLMLPQLQRVAPEPAKVKDMDAEPGPDGTLTLPAISLSLSFREAKNQLVDAFERAFIQGKFEECGRNVSRTAQVLDMHRQSLQQKLKDLGISRSAEEE
jgi:DNA-binding NtrC family response regulator